jgi:hypothetical protein
MKPLTQSESQNYEKYYVDSSSSPRPIFVGEAKPSEVTFRFFPRSNHSSIIPRDECEIDVNQQIQKEEEKGNWK